MAESLMHKSPMLILAGTLMVAGCSGGPLTTREKGAGIGAVGGVAAGAGSLAPQMATQGLERRSMEAWAWAREL